MLTEPKDGRGFNNYWANIPQNDISSYRSRPPYHRSSIVYRRRSEDIGTLQKPNYVPDDGNHFGFYIALSLAPPKYPNSRLLRAP